jgi:hypothetical protein
MAGSFPPASSSTNAINEILTQEANRISPDIHRQTLGMSPWMDLIRKSEFADGMGYQRNVLIYDRALPLNDGNNTGTFDVLGLNWANLAQSALTADNSALNSAALIAGSSTDNVGPYNKSARIDFTRKLKSFNLQRATVQSPRINVEDLRFAAYRQEQLGAIMDILKDSTQRSWIERYRDEYERVAANLVPCLSTATPILTTVNTDGDSTADDLFEGAQVTDVRITTSGASNADVTPTANISNKVLDKIYYALVRQGAGSKAYGRENARPVYGLVLSSEASYALMTEAGFRDDVRYDASKVSELLAPLGIEKSFRGFYHLVDDLCPRYSIAGATITRVRPEVYSSGVLIMNPSYDTADYEAAYVLHEEVMESQIPNPITSGGAGVSFNPTDYKGKFTYLNILNETTNPDGVIGFFRGVLASATKPIKTNFGYVILFKRTSSTPAA